MPSAKRVLSPIKTENSAGQPKKLKSNIKNASSLEQENDFFMDDDSDFDLSALTALEMQHTAQKLHLANWQRCVVQQVDRDPKTYDLVLQLRADGNASGGTEPTDTTGDPATAICRLQGPWSQTHVAVGDLLSVQAHWQPDLGSYAVNRDYGFCVTQPDVLISGTTVTSSLFCRRKAVLQDRFRGVDSNSSVMVIGSLAHELLQTVLTQQIRTSAEVEAALESMLSTKQLARTLYESKMSHAEARIELEQFVTPIVAFIEQYVDVKSKQDGHVPKDMYQACIAEIQDIEENLWVPQLGLKGKVDVSVRVRKRHKRSSNDATAATAPIPLELKTGRASFSMEHKGQLLLYQLMHSAQGRDTHSGLLLYLREGIMREVNSARNEQRDLIVLRNDLAHYLTRPPPQLADGDADSASMPFVLPEPISHHSACGKCAYNTVCCSFAEADSHLQLRDSHPLRQVMAQALQHLTPADHAYFLRWCGLLALEEQSARQSQNLRALWTERPEVRQRQGRAVCGLQLQPSSEVIHEDSRYLQTLQLAPEAELDLTLSGFEVGEYVIISSTSRLAIAAGFISALGMDFVRLQLERDLRQKYRDARFIMDKHESQSFNTFNFANLGLLLEDSERAAQLRSIVIERRPLGADRKVLPKIVATQGAPMLAQLNGVQRAAALRALTIDSYLLIKGLPGTGKTQTLVAIVRLLHLMGRSVLITAQTHSAVDNLLLRLQSHGLPLLRLGATARIHPELRQYSEEALTRDSSDAAQLAAVLEAQTIVGVTCLGAGHALFQHRRFDYCIVDEATQVMQPTTLRPLSHCDRFILVGDPDQLPPLVKSREARQRGADESLFQRLDCEAATAVLTLQYRMNRTITKLANELTYKGALRCGGAAIETATLQLQTELAADSAKWLQRALQAHVEQSVLLLDTLDCATRSHAYASNLRRVVATCAGTEHDDGLNIVELADGGTKQRSRHVSKYNNYCEAAVVFHIVRQLLRAGCAASRIGVIAPYRAQVELLRKLGFGSDVAADEYAGIEFNTVDQYQGRDKDVIIYSCTKTGANGSGEAARESEILEDQRRLTVAITRAKHKLIVLGDVQCLERYAPFRLLFEHIPARCRLQLTDGRMGFSWQALLNELSELMGD